MIQRRHDADISNMMARHTHMTLAYAFIAGSLTGYVAGWLLVPAVLPVNDLTPIALAGPMLGLAVGSMIVAVRRASTADAR